MTYAEYTESSRLEMEIKRWTLAYKHTPTKGNAMGLAKAKFKLNKIMNKEK